jgi:hypothetical protein
MRRGISLALVMFIGAMLASAGPASAFLHVQPGKTYFAEVPKTNLTVFVKTVPRGKPKSNGGQTTAVAALECGHQLARVNPSFTFRRGSGFLRPDTFTSAPGNTGNGIFDISGRVSGLAGFAIKSTINVTQVPTCFNSKANRSVTLKLAGRKVSQNLAFQLAQGVHFPASLAATCPSASAYNQPVTLSGRLSPDTGGSVIAISGGNNRGGVVNARVATVADGSFSFTYTPFPGPETKYTENLTLSFSGGPDRDPATATCSWPVGPP